jgi:hypothetical protein
MILSNTEGRYAKLYNLKIDEAELRYTLLALDSRKPKTCYTFTIYCCSTKNNIDGIRSIVNDSNIPHKITFTDESNKKLILYSDVVEFIIPKSSSPKFLIKGCIQVQLLDRKLTEVTKFFL